MSEAADTRLGPPKAVEEPPAAGAPVGEWASAGSGAAGTASAGTASVGRASAGRASAGRASAAGRGWLLLVARWGPLAALVGLATALRFSTLGTQSVWYDEAFGPVHVFHTSLVATLEVLPRTENTPPLWYIVEWAVIRIAGNGAFALRFISALAGVATVPVAWATGRELAGRRAALIAAGLTAVSPLFVWYSQEARAYALFTFLCALAFLLFIRAERRPSAGRIAAFAAASGGALLTHYFAVFLVVPMALWLARRRESRTGGLGALVTIGAVGAALLPLALAQGGRGAEWIGKLTLASRVEAIPQYYLLGYSPSGGNPLGRGIELAVALPLIAGVLWGLGRMRSRVHARGAALALGVAACGVLVPVALIPFGADYVDPRNLIGAMVPLTAFLAVAMGARGAGRAGMALAALAMVAFLAITIDIDRSPRLQRGDWRGVASLLRAPAPGASGAPTGTSQALAPERVVSTVHLGSAPLQYYMSRLHAVRAGSSVMAREIDEVGYFPLAKDAGSPPLPGFRFVGRSEAHGLFVYRFVSRAPRAVPVGALLARPLTVGQGLPQVLASGRARARRGA